MAVMLGWERTTLGEVFDRLQYGYTASASADTPGPRFLRITDLQDHGVDWSSVPGCQIVDVDLEKYRLRDGDIVFARSGSIEKAWRVKDVPTAVFASYLIRGTPLIPALGEWLEAFVKSPSYLVQIGAAGAGSGMQNVNATNLGRVELPLPPLKEQRRIVAKLGAIFAQTRAAKSRLERLPTLLEKLKRSILAAAFRGDLTKDWRAANPDVEPGDVLLDRIRTERRRRWEDGLRAKGKDPKEFSPAANDSVWSTDDPPSAPVFPGTVTAAAPNGWMWCRLLDLARLESGHTPRKSVPEYWDGGDIPWISLQDIREADGRTILSTKLMPTALGIECSSARLLPAGTVVFSRDISVGYATVMGRSMSTTQHFANWVCSDNIRPKYLMHALIASRDSLIRSGEGTTVRTIYMPALERFSVLLPSIDEQDAIVASIEAAMSRVERLDAASKHSAANIETMERAAFAKAFRGELVPQDPADEPASVLLDRIRAACTAETERPRRGRGQRRADTVVDEGTATVTTDDHSIHGDHDESLDLVLGVFQIDRRLTTSAIAAATGLDASAVKKALTTLVDSGQVRVHGRARGTTYEWAT